MSAAKPLRLGLFLLLGTTLLAASPVLGRLKHDPVKIRLAGIPRDVKTWENYEGTLEIEAGRDVTLENLRIVTEDLSLETGSVAGTLHLAKGEHATVAFTVVPVKRDGRIGISYEADGRAYSETLSPAAVYEIASRWAGKAKPAAGSLRAGETQRWPDRKWPVETEEDHPDPFRDEDDLKGAVGSLSRSIRVTGGFWYQRADGTIEEATGMPFTVYDEDNSWDEELATGTLDEDGRFDVTFTWDPCLVCDSNPDLYIEVLAQNSDIDVQTAWLEWTYGWVSWVEDDYTGSDYDFGIMTIDDNVPAAHMFRMLKYAFAAYAAQGYNLDQVDVQWPADNTEYSSITDEIYVTKGRQWQEGSYFHELGHHWQHKFTYTPTADYCNAWCDDGVLDCGHCMWCEEEQDTAHLEGVAHFLSYLIGESLHETVAPPPANWRTQEHLSECYDGVNEFYCDCDPWDTEGFIFAFLEDLADSENENDSLYVDDWADVTDLDGWALASLIDLETPHKMSTWWPYLVAWFPGEREEMWETGRNDALDFDTEPPSVVSDLHSTSHDVALPSPDATMNFNWTTPEDDASGIGGYAYVLSEDAPVAPGLTMNLGKVEFFGTEALAPGTYYLTLRTFDRDHKYSASYATAGPYVIREPYLSDLIFHDPGSWPLALVPYPDWYSDPGGPPAPYALEGWTGTTYWNYAGKNNGESPIPETFTNRLFVDGVFTDENTLSGGSPWMDFSFKNRGPVVVKGGRHTFGCMLDVSEVVPETDESNNVISYQYVWSPRDLMPDTDEIGGPPPDPLGGWDGLVNPGGFNEDGYRFYAGSWWSAVAMKTHHPFTEYQLRLHEPSTGPDDGFAASLAWSAEPAGHLNAVIVNCNQIPFQDWDVGVLNAEDDASSFFTLRQVESTSLGQYGTASWSWGEGDYLALFEVMVPSQQEGAISVTLGTDDPDHIVHLGWLDQDFTTGTLLDARKETWTDKLLGRARLDLDVERVGSHCFAVWRDPGYSGEAANLVLEVFQTPADLIPDTPSNWYAPIVPRPFYAVTPYVVSEPDTLYGDTEEIPATWFCLAAKDVGPLDADGVPSWIYLDGARLWGHEWLVLLSGIGEYEFVDNLFNIPAGRHTLSFHVDDPDQNVEISETNNLYGEQWIWGPVPVQGPGPHFRATPPDPMGGWDDITTEEPPAFNCDAVRLSAPVWPDTTGWRVFAAVPGDASNVDLRLHDAGTGAKNGLDPSLVSSQWGPDQIDYLLVHDEAYPGPDYDVSVTKVIGESGYYFSIPAVAEWETPIGTHGPYYLGQVNFMAAFVFDLAPGTYDVTLESLSGYIQWGMSLHDTSEAYQSRSRTVLNGSSWLNGPGEGEEMIVEVAGGGPHCLTVWSADGTGMWETGEYTITVSLVGGTGVPEVPPDACGLLSVHPNPCTSSSRVSYRLNEETQVELAVFDVRGGRVCTLEAGTLPAGQHEAVWTGTDEGGRPVSSGVYLVRLVAGATRDVQKVLLLP